MDISILFSSKNDGSFGFPVEGGFTTAIPEETSWKSTPRVEKRTYFQVSQNDPGTRLSTGRRY
jgi:hypothetical protein